MSITDKHKKLYILTKLEEFYNQLLALIDEYDVQDAKVKEKIDGLKLKLKIKDK